MKKKKRNTARMSDVDTAGPLDWTPLFQAFKEAFNWALDVGVQLARDYPEEVEAVERVRTFMHKRIAGGAQKSHWFGLDEVLKGHLVTKSEDRMKIDRMLNGAYKPFLPSVDMPAHLKKTSAQLSTEIEDINEVRRDIAHEIADLDEPAS